jgi:acyl-CoA synthetase (AMP-forming)/AMP-acid ligase II
MWFSEILDRHCQQRGDAPAVVEGEVSLTWRELRSAAHSVAAHLHSLGIGRGDRVAVYSRNRYEIIVSYFALAHLGAPFVPVNHAMSAAEYAEVAERLDVRHVMGEQRLVGRLDLPSSERTIYDDEFRKILESDAAPPPLAARMEDPLAILLTSGTTGRPKGVLQTSEALRLMTLSWLAEVHADDSVRLLNLNSLAHGGVTVTFHYLAAGATLHLQREFQPRAALREIQQRGITHIWLVPQMLRFMLAAVKPGTTVESRLREILFGASPLGVDVLEDAMRVFGCTFRNVYGMTEAGGTFCTWLSGRSPEESGEVPLASSGRSVPGLRVEIRDEADRPLPTGEIGEVCVRSWGRMSHYVGDRAATDETIVNGWVRTGDLGWMDEHGYVHISDRKKDVIKRGGQNVFPAEIENAVRRFPGVHDVGVVGVPDPVWTEVPHAYVAMEEGATATAGEIMRFLRGRLATYKQPEHITFVDEIPRNGAGKVLRRVLAQEARTAGQTSDETVGGGSR